MQKIRITDFYEEFRPYNEKETLEALKRISKDRTFQKIIYYFFPELNEQSYSDFIHSIKSIYDLQKRIMYPVSEKIISDSTTGFSFSGLENIKKDKHYVFISNHRDIVLDATFFEYILLANNFDSTEVTFGNNLMEDPLILDIGKSNKMFKVYRKGSPKELLKKTFQLSEYIRYTVLNKRQSIWVAQRGGRTKNGDDKTYPGVIKMLNASGTKSFEENIKELNIVPLSVSYEFEPNDHMKVCELLQTVNGKYQKKPNEDILSIIDGVQSQKGKVHIAIGKPVEDDLTELQTIARVNDKISEFAKLLDKEIYRNYRLYPNNYIAFDLLNKTKKYASYYSEHDIKIFTEYKKEQLAKIQFPHTEAEELFLKIYANPVVNIMENHIS